MAKRGKHFEKITDKQLLAEVDRRGIKYPIYEDGTQVRGKAGTHEKTWTDKHRATVTSFRYCSDGTIEYRVRCWRQNTHWWRAENLERIPDSELCAGCKGLLAQGCKCHRVCPCGCCNG